MPYFVINGMPDCPNYMHAIHVAQYLSDHLANFEYMKVEKSDKEWARYLLDLNKENNWFITNSPLIWKEINMWGGKKYLLGGLSEFWEYCYCYYGFASVIPKQELQKLADDNAKFFKEQELKATQQMSNVRIVSILGVSNPVTALLLKDLLEIKALEKEEGVLYRLYDDMAQHQSKVRILEDIMETYNDFRIYGSRDIVALMHSEKEAVENCDLLIHMEDFRQRQNETAQDWHERCYSRMNRLSENINKCNNRSIKIIFNNPGPVCLLATCLVEFCTTVKPSNIVAVTVDEGLSFINVVSQKTGIPVFKMSAPPVWGFVGINCFVDGRSIVFKADVYRPNKRSLTAPRGSTLPLGTIKSELRLMSYMITDYNEIVKIIEENRRKINTILQRPPSLAKRRAVCSLIRLWYSKERSDQIISLGVCSNGSFGIPPGIVFSQPVKLDEKRKWVPYSNFPLVNDMSIIRIKECITATTTVLENLGHSLLMCSGEESDVLSASGTSLTTAQTH